VKDKVLVESRAERGSQQERWFITALCAVMNHLLLRDLLLRDLLLRGLSCVEPLQSGVHSAQVNPAQITS
jgi:hypothetical protein